MSIEADLGFVVLPIRSLRTACADGESHLKYCFRYRSRRVVSRGYHSLLSSFGKIFHVEKRWKLVREMGSGAYGVVMSVVVFFVLGAVTHNRTSSAADDISGETVAIKLVTRVFEKIQLAKRALREITLLRHFAGHENITGLIDVDAISPDFNEMYVLLYCGLILV